MSLHFKRTRGQHSPQIWWTCKTGEQAALQWSIAPQGKGGFEGSFRVLGQSPISFHVQIPFKSTKLDTIREAPLKSVDIAKTAKLPQSLLSNRHHEARTGSLGQNTVIGYSQREKWKTNLTPWKTMKTTLEPWKTMKTDSAPWKANREQWKTKETHPELREVFK